MVVFFKKLYFLETFLQEKKKSKDRTESFINSHIWFLLLAN